MSSHNPLDTPVGSGWTPEAAIESLTLALSLDRECDLACYTYHERVYYVKIQRKGVWTRIYVCSVGTKNNGKDAYYYEVRRQSEISTGDSIYKSASEFWK